MSVREEEERRRRNNCTNRGLGLAAAAIGVGVGAALYYFFSKRPENPDSEGSTSGNWSCEQPQSLINTQASDKSEYTTISEHTTTDTSIWLTDNDNNNTRKKQIRKKTINRFSSNSDSSTSTMDSSSEDNEPCCSCCYNSSEPGTEDEYSVTDTENSEEESEDSTDEEEDEHSNSSYSNTEPEYDSSEETGYITLRTTSSHSFNQRSRDSSDSDMDHEWDITSSSADMPTDTNTWSSPFLNFINRLTSPRLRNMTPADGEHTRVIREQTFRDRRWSLEECAICFEVMLKDQPLMQLPCTHNFHVACIGPWLREQQTCPMCRKAAE